MCCFFFQAEDGIRDLVRSRGLGDVYKRQAINLAQGFPDFEASSRLTDLVYQYMRSGHNQYAPCLLYTSDAADERSSVDLGGRRIIKKKKNRRQ